MKILTLQHNVNFTLSSFVNEHAFTEHCTYLISFLVPAVGGGALELVSATGVGDRGARVSGSGAAYTNVEVKSQATTWLSRSNSRIAFILEWGGNVFTLGCLMRR